MFATTLLACRLTAGPPPRQTETPLAPTSPAFVATSSPPPLPGTKETSGRTSPTLTPIVLPSPTPLPTLLDHLAEGMPAIQPRNWAEVRRLARFGEEGQPAFTSLDFSRDGQFMAAVTCEQALKLWEVPGGEQLPVPTGEVSSGCEGSWKAAFSPVAGLLATTGTALIDESAWNVVQLWTVSRDFGGQSLQSLPASRKPVTSLAFSPDGRLLAAGTQENSLILWFIPEPDQPHTTTITKLGELVHTDWVVDVAFSPDGRILAAATAEPESDRFTPVIHLWSVQELLAKEIGSAAPAVTLEAPAGPLRKVTFSPDGRWLAAAGSGITIWEAQTGKQRLFLEAPTDTLAFSPDSRLLAAAGRDLLLFWDLRASLRSGKIEAQDWMELQGVEGDIAGLSFSPDGIALGMISEDGSLILWGIWPEGSGSLQNKDIHGSKKMLFRSKVIVFYILIALAFLPACVTPPPSPDGNTPPSTPPATASSPAPPASPTVEASPPSTSSPTAPPLPPTETGTPAQASPTAPAPTEPAGWPPITPENAVEVDKVARLPAPGLAGLAWSPRGDDLAIVSDQGVTVYLAVDLKNAPAPPVGSFVPTGPTHPASVSLSPDGRTVGVLIHEEFTVQLWDVATGEQTRSLAWTDHAAPVLYGAVFSPDWSQLAWYTRGTVQFMNVATGELGPMVNYEEFIQAVAFSPEGQFFASATLGTVGEEFIPVIQVWDAGDGEPYATLSGHLGGVILLEFSQDETLLAAATGEGEVLAWDVAAGQLLQTLGGHTTGVTDLAFTPDGQGLVVLSPDGSARFWDLTSGQLVLSWTGMQVAVLEDGRLLAFQTDSSEMMLIEVASGEELRGLETPPSLASLDFSPGGGLLAGISPEEPAVHLWGVKE